MHIFSSLLASVIPITLYLLLLWRFDKYEREPFLNIAKHFLWGAIGAIVISLFFSQFFVSFTSFFSPTKEVTSLLSVVLIAPFVEELTKSFYLIKSSRSDEFDNLTDGLIYGGAIGLGFGMTENFFYFITYGDTISQWILLVVIRSGFSAVMHCVSTSVVGSFIAMSKFSKKKSSYLFAGLLLAMLIHFGWNLSVSFESTYYPGFLVLFIIIIAYLFILRFSIKREQKIILIELKDELPPPNILAFFNSRKAKSKNQNEYKLIKLYSKLAFARHIMKNKKGNKAHLLEKIDNLQTLINSNLGK